MQYRIDLLQSDDWEAVKAIYLEGIATGNATFEIAAPDWQTWNAAHLPFGRLVARPQQNLCDQTLFGWAALSPVSSRCVYAGVAEVSVYIAAAARGQGVGRALLQRLIEDSEANGIWTLQAGILPENLASLAIHEQCGFREVGRREKLGKLHGAWRDVVVMERRSRRIGVE